MQLDKVIGRSVKPKGTIEGSYNNNPILNSLCNMKFPGSEVKEY